MRHALRQLHVRQKRPSSRQLPIPLALPPPRAPPRRLARPHHHQEGPGRKRVPPAHQSSRVTFSQARRGWKGGRGKGGGSGRPGGGIHTYIHTCIHVYMYTVGQAKWRHGSVLASIGGPAIAPGCAQSRTAVRGSGAPRTDQVTSSQVRSGQVRSGQVRSGQVRSGQVKSNQGKSRQVKANQGKSRQVESSRVESSRVAY